MRATLRSAAGMRPLRRIPVISITPYVQERGSALVSCKRKDESPPPWGRLLKPRCVVACLPEPLTRRRVSPSVSNIGPARPDVFPVVALNCDPLRNSRGIRRFGAVASERPLERRATANQAADELGKHFVKDIGSSVREVAAAG